MATEWICDGCGRRAPGVPGPDHNWHKPRSWYERSDDDGIQVACCRECIETVAAASGKTAVVLPI
jgi:hypothetical protein